MKQLILIRHAKSSWEYDVIDHERPLKQRGLNDAKLVSNELRSHDLQIDQVLISDAKRTRETAEIILQALHIPKNIVVLNHKLYDFSGYDLTEVIKSCDTKVNALLIFGHNHAITAFANTYGSLYIANVPTCGVVSINFEISNWSEIYKGKTIFTIFPRDLK